MSGTDIMQWVFITLLFAWCLLLSNSIGKLASVAKLMSDAIKVIGEALSAIRTRNSL